jgi:hypothetical protein
MNKGGTHYGNMFDPHAMNNLLIEPVDQMEMDDPDSGILINN